MKSKNEEIIENNDSEVKRDEKIRKKNKVVNYFKLIVGIPISLIIFIVIIFGFGRLYEKLNSEKKGVATVVAEDTVSAANVIAKAISDEVKNDVVGEEGELKIEITELNIEKVFENSQLSTSEYSYGAIYTQYDEKGEKVEYYAAYDGTVKIGIDFSKVTVDINETDKTIYIYTPKCKVQDVSVDVTDFIFINKKAETETVVVETINICKDELKDRAKNDSKLMKMSANNTIMVIKALTVPLVAQVDEEYKVEVMYGEEAK